MKFWLPAIFLVAVILFVVFHPGPAKAPEPCSAEAPACIKITEADGRTYKLNDFRFLPGHCISFISKPDNSQKKYCGNYKLDWIGPNPSRQ